MKKYRAVETQSLILPQLMAEYRMLTSAGDIPPCLAVLFDYSLDKRMAEYNCSVTFTDFIAEEFFQILIRLQDHHDHSRDADKQYRQCSW